MQATAIRSSKRNARWKYLSVILVLGGLFVIPVFAAETTTSSLGGVGDILQTFLSVMSWGRVVLATLAGKMMTNDRVFGAALHMDIYLRKIWNIMKNFANFGLLAFLLGTIIKNLISGGDLGKEIKGIITKTLVAGILIQASRFMMGALVDVSTVAVSAIGSFPTSFMQNNAEFKTHMDKAVKDIRKKDITVTNGGGQDGKITVSNTNSSSTPNPMSEQDILDGLMPTSNSLGGPLVFLGASVFRFYDYLGTDPNESLQITAVNFSLKTIVLLIFTIALLLLLIANIVRVAFLRIFIIASPFIVLFKVFKDDKMPGEGKGIAKYLSLAGLIDLVFKPVLFMAMMSLILIVVVCIQNIMISQSTIDLNGVSMSVSPSNSNATLSIDGVSSVTVNDNLFKSFDDTGLAEIGNGGKSIFADLILFFLTIFLMRKLVVWSLTTGKGPIQDVMGPVTKFIENFAKTAPIFGGTSVNALLDMSKQTTGEYAKALGMDKNSRSSGKFTRQEGEFQNTLREALGLGTSWKQQHFDTLSTAVRSGDPNAFWSETTNIASKKVDEGLSMNSGNNGEWKKLLEEWFTRYGATPNRGNTGFKGKYNGDLKKFLTEAPKAVENRRALYQAMGAEQGKLKGYFTITAPPSYEQLMDNRYYVTT